MGTLVYTSRMTGNIRTVVYFEKAQREALEKLSEKTGAPLGELIRRAVAAYLKAQK